MKCEWPTVPLANLVDRDRGISYGIVQPGPPIDQGVPIVRVTNVRDGRITTADPLRVSPVVESKYLRTRLKGGELLLTLVGTIGETAIVPDSLAGWNTARAVAVIPVRRDVGSYWVKLALQSKDVQQIIDSRLNTTVQATLNLRDVAQLPIVMPPLGEQRAIAHILGTLDDKIELNRRMSETLEAMARALFKSWFVDFDPIRAKLDNRWQPGQSLPGLPAHLHDLFPDRLVDSELGDIPEGWVAGCVGNEFNVTMGQSPPGHTYNTDGDGTPFYQGRSDFTFRFPARRVYCTEPTRLAEAGDTLVSVRAPVGDVNMASEGCAVGRGVAAARHKSCSRSYTYYFMCSINRVFSSFEADGTVFGSIGKKDFHAIPCSVAPDEVIHEFEQICAPIDERIDTNARETHTLTALRDTLLPKLISGELRIRDAEHFLTTAKVSDQQTQAPFDAESDDMALRQRKAGD